MHAHRLTATDRAAAAFLLVLMSVGSLALWIGIPAGWLWIAGKVTDDTAQHFLLSVLGAPLAIIAWARFLFWLNRLYLRITSPAMLEPDEEEVDDEQRFARGPIEPLLVVSLALALIALSFWFFVLAENPSPSFF